MVIAGLAVVVLPKWLVWDVFLPYALGTIIFVVGLVVIGRVALAARGLEKVVAFGPLFLAMPMAVFSGEHFADSKQIASIVPSWMPWHLFWAFFVGACLFAAALSMVARKLDWLAAGLTWVMFMGFVTLMDIPGVVQEPRNRIIWVLAVRELTFGLGALALAVSRREAWEGRVRDGVLKVTRTLIGMAIVFYGVEHFLHPGNAPGVPLELVIPDWIPARFAIAYLTGAVFVGGGLCMVVNWKARLAATWVGLMVFVVVMAVYLPLLIAKPSDIGVAANYFFDTLMLSGAVLALAGGLREEAMKPAE